MPALALAAALLAAPLAMQRRAAADVYPPPPRHSRATDETPPEWQRLKLLVAGAVGVPLQPADFERYWNPAAAIGLSLSAGIAPALDLVAQGEGYKMHLDERRFQEDFAALPEPGDHDALVGPALLLLRLHPAREGFRGFVDAGVGVMDVSRPAIFYHDASGNLQTLEGAEIFGFDWCYSVGVGIEWTWYRRAFGAMVESRFVNAPGRTEPAHTIATLRSGIQYTIPRIAWFGSHSSGR